jgi:hypothetical protein
LIALARIELISLSLLVVEVEAAARNNVVPAKVGARLLDTVEAVNDSVDLVAMRKRTDRHGNFIMRLLLSCVVGFVIWASCHHE